jgi:hypothetical protein
MLNSVNTVDNDSKQASILKPILTKKWNNSQKKPNHKMLTKKFTPFFTNRANIDTKSGRFKDTSISEEKRSKDGFPTPSKKVIQTITTKRTKN